MVKHFGQRVRRRGRAGRGGRARPDAGAREKVFVAAPTGADGAVTELRIPVGKGGVAPAH